MRSVDMPRQWPCVLALATAPLAPATTARRTVETPLKWALLVHVAGLTLLYLAEGTFPDDSGFGWCITFRPLTWIYQLLAWPRISYEWTVILKIASLLVSEGIIWIVAALLMGWGAVDEPFARSYRHALRRLWLQTSHLAVIAMVVNSLSGGLARAERLSREQVRASLGPGPVFPSAGRSNSEVRARYKQQRREYEKEYQRRAARQERPWYLLQVNPVCMACRTALLACFLVTLLRALGIQRSPEPQPRGGPACRLCGYNLKGIPADHRCPECGRPSASSVGPSAGPGTVWQRRRRGQWISAALRTFWQATVHPPRLAADMQVPSADPTHRSYLALCLVPVFLTGLATIPTYQLVHYLTVGVNPAKRWQATWVSSYFEIALALVVCVLLLTLGTALAFGLYYRARYRRNLLFGTMRAASYQAGLLVPWTMVTALSIAAATSRFLGQNIGLWHQALGEIRSNAPFFFYGWVILVVGLLWFYLRNVRLTCMGVQYAWGTMPDEGESDTA
ncbi:MAG: hypothetical protein JXQ73_05605 [Phycisphaerae bacterium]|nr:hypothetical protein [Phycisphaerae bacterium]